MGGLDTVTQERFSAAITSGIWEKGHLYPYPRSRELVRECAGRLGIIVGVIRSTRI